MSEIFNDKTTAEIDAKLHRDILKHNLNIEKISIGLVILLMILFRGWIFFVTLSSLACDIRRNVARINFINL